MNTKISIPQPCNQEWSKMSASKNGKYCDECKLTVVDFTKMSDEEIQSYLIGKSYVCGRFNCSQIYNQTYSKLDSMKEKAQSISFAFLKYIVLCLIALPLFVSSCMRGSFKGKKNNTDTNKKDKSPHLMGLVIMPKDNKKFKI